LLLLQAAVAVIRSIDSDTVNVVLTSDQKELSNRIESELKDANIKIVSIVTTNDNNWINTIRNTNTSIVVSLLHNHQLRSFFGLQNNVIRSMSKLWINIPADGYAMTEKERIELMMKGGTNSQLVVLQRHKNEFIEYKNYFIGVVKNNYPSYSLLATYVQQVQFIANNV
jgi:hypothetical protein